MKLLYHLLPLLIFFGAFKFYDIYVATAAAILVTFIQVGVFYLKNRRIESIHIMMIAMLTVFGGLTILLQDDTFIKWKPTIVNCSFTAIIFYLMFTKKTALEYILGSQISLPPPVWRKLNTAWALFFLFLGFLNLYIAFYYNLDADDDTRTQTWVNFKVFGMLGLTLVFAIAQMFFLSKHIKVKEEK